MRKPVTLTQTELDLSRRVRFVSTSTAQMTGLLHPGLALLHVLSGLGVLCQSWGILLVCILHITCNPLKMSPLLASVLSPFCPDSDKIQWEGQISLRFQIAMIGDGTCRDPEKSPGNSFRMATGLSSTHAHDWG